MNGRIFIVGQGISGSLLYYFLNKAGIDCVVIDNDKPNSASKVAAGLINPVTGRRMVKTWMIDELLPAIKKTYREIEDALQINCLQEKELTWFFPAIDILQSFEKRIVEKTDYLAESQSTARLSDFNYPYKSGNVKPAYVVDVQELLSAFRKSMKDEGRFMMESFDYKDLKLADDGLTYKDHAADKIIFCEGYAAVNNPWFNKLPYSLNKGEALILEIDDLPKDAIYKFKQTLVPLLEGNLWWYGSNYVWEFEDEAPTKNYREGSEAELKSWLKLPFKIFDHKAAVRYATVERRPFIGFHPVQKQIGIFNGWGTKGCSLAPYWAEQFANAILGKTYVSSEVDIARYTKILTAEARREPKCRSKWKIKTCTLFRRSIARWRIFIYFSGS